MTQYQNLVLHSKTLSLVKIIKTFNLQTQQTPKP